MNTRTAAALVATGAFVVRFLRLGAIENDHYVYLARAHQLLHGDWPIRNFVDPGIPLGYMVSALAAAVAGPTLLTEAVVSVLMFALAVAVTFALARRASGSVFIALAAAAIVLLLPPRLYNSTKILVPLVAMALAWAWDDRPTTTRASILGAWTGLAFLVRHDYAVYVCAAAVVLFAVRHRANWKPLVSSALTFGAVALFIAAPWLVYVQVEQGLVPYFASAARFSIAEGARTASHWAPAYYAVAAVPLATLLIAGRGTDRLRAPQIVFATVLVLLSDLVLLRDEPGARLPDVYAVTLVTAAILAGRFIPARAASQEITRSAWTGFAAAAAGLVILVLAGLADALPGRVNIPERWHLVATRLREARPEITPEPSRSPLIDYITRCTTPDERVLVGGFAPEIPVLAHRPFAGGLPDWIAGYYEAPADIAQARHQLARERLAVAVMLDGSDRFIASWPALAADIESRGLERYELPLETGRVELWIRPANRRDDRTGLPCS